FVDTDCGAAATMPRPAITAAPPKLPLSNARRDSLPLFLVWLVMLPLRLQCGLQRKPFESPGNFSADDNTRLQKGTPGANPGLLRAATWSQGGDFASRADYWRRSENEIPTS